MIWAALTLGLAGAAAAPLQAEDPAPRQLGAWTVTVSKDRQGCFLTRQYDRSGDTTLLLGLDRDGSNHLSVLNANWSIRPKDRLKLDFRLSRGSYPRHFAIGIASDGKRGFVTSFEPKFPGYFASAAMLAIARGDVPVERLALDGSGAAVTALRRCVDGLRSPPRAQARDTVAPGDIPRDPFAHTPRHPSRQAR
ncbi:hypothetical protein RN629_13435 [Sphingomonadaceae bacterium jetA1]|jgi:hypothetical protein|uniref:hypothetical protein n=1 Tax=Facivitalis istanbulensis TaxID=3075838 RepID=UPI00346A6012